MPSAKPRILLHLEYERSAEEYLRSLPLEHFMEGVPQATQREITLESLAVLKVRRRRRDLHIFNELLIQYPKGDAIAKVVPDNMGVVYDGELRVETNYGIPFQPVGPLVVMEYVSKGSQRKDYEESFQKYEQDLKIPYYLLFYPDNQELTLYRHDGQRYVTVLPDENGRRALPELELEIGLLEGWVRFWHQGELLPLPAELDGQVQEAVRRAREEARLREEADRRAQEEARLREEADRRAQEEARLREEADRRAQEEARLREEADRRAQEEARLREEADRRAQEEARLRAEAEQARQALEQEIARLRAQIGPPP